MTDTKSYWPDLHIFLHMCDIHPLTLTLAPTIFLNYCFLSIILLHACIFAFPLSHYSSPHLSLFYASFPSFNFLYCIMHLLFLPALPLLFPPCADLFLPHIIPTALSWPNRKKCPKYIIVHPLNLFKRNI